MPEKTISLKDSEPLSRIDFSGDDIVIVGKESAKEMWLDKRWVKSRLGGKLTVSITAGDMASLYELGYKIKKSGPANELALPGWIAGALPKGFCPQKGNLIYPARLGFTLEMAVKLAYTGRLWKRLRSYVLELRFRKRGTN
ncbi:MAG: hypothetical protein ABH829_05270 [archaeon]